jgi:hypothetical protein
LGEGGGHDVAFWPATFAGMLYQGVRGFDGSR